MKAIPKHVADKVTDVVIHAVPTAVDNDLQVIAERMAFYTQAIASVAGLVEDAPLSEAEMALYDQIQDVRIKLSELHGALEDVSATLHLYGLEDEDEDEEHEGWDDDEVETDAEGDEDIEGPDNG